MFNRIPTSVLMAAVAAVVAVDAFVAMPLADAEDNAVADEAVPEVPLTAFLTGPTSSEVVIDGVHAGVYFADGKPMVRFTNPTREDITLAVNVRGVATSGSPMSRMGPMSASLGTSHLSATVPAGGSTDVALGIEVAEPPPVEEPETEEEIRLAMFTAFTSTSIQFYEGEVPEFNQFAAFSRGIDMNMIVLDNGIGDNGLNRLNEVNFDDGLSDAEPAVR